MADLHPLALAKLQAEAAVNLQPVESILGTSGPAMAMHRARTAWREAGSPIWAPASPCPSCTGAHALPHPNAVCAACDGTGVAR